MNADYVELSCSSSSLSAYLSAVRRTFCLYCYVCFQYDYAAVVVIAIVIVIVDRLLCMLSLTADISWRTHAAGFWSWIEAKAFRTKVCVIAY